METEDYTNSLRDFLTVLFKHKLKIITVFAAVVIIVAARTFVQPPVYEAESRLMIQFGREYIFRSEVGDTEPTIHYNRDEVINSDIQILTSPDLIEKVINNLGVENIYPDLVEQPPDQVKQPQDQIKQPPVEIAPLQAATRRFSNQLSVMQLRNSNIINVSLQHLDRQVPARAVNVLVEFFKERHLQLFSTSQTPFLERQLAVHRQRLQESENNLVSFKQRNQIPSLEQQRDNNFKQRLAFDTELKTAQNRIQELQQMISSLTGQMQKASEDIPLNEQTRQAKDIANTQNELLQLQVAEQELVAKYTESNPELAQIRNQIQIVKNFLAEQQESLSETMTEGKNPVYQEMEINLFKARAELSAQDAKCAALKQQLNQLDGEIQDLDAKESELRSLELERDNNEKNYQLYLTKLEEARISDDLDRSKMANIKVIQKAITPLKPVPSKKKLKIAIGIILGAASGLTLALFSEYVINEGLSSPQGVKKRLGLPVLASVPYKGQKKSRA